MYSSPSDEPHGTLQLSHASRTHTQNTPPSTLHTPACVCEDPPPQKSHLCCNAHRAGVCVALAHHDETLSVCAVILLTFCHRLFAAHAINSQDLAAGPVTADDEGPSVAVRLLWAGVAADPSILSYSAAGSVLQWQAPLTSCAKVVAKLHALQQAARHLPPAGAADQQPAWLRVGSAELQLCQSGLQQLLEAVSAERNPACHPAAVYRCLQALEVAAGEYWAANKSDGLFSRSSIQQPPGPAAGQGEGTAGVVTSTMHLELLRAFHWCVWLLGAV